MNLFKKYESMDSGFRIDLEPMLTQIQFNNQGLVPVIAQQHDTKEVLMLAWMNEEALLETLNSGRVCYWSRSRSALWRKGESSGQVQILKQLALDCDGDTILLQVDQTGPACHTGRRHCFFYQVSKDGVKIEGEVIIPPEQLYKK